ncbi:MAG: serine/threonine-protein kinase [Gemmatimonadota bacterium]
MEPPASILENRYRLADRIAVGGMGEVWRAEDLLLSRAVAVKLLRPAYAQDDSGRTRFRAEARYAGSLSHPNIAQIYDYGAGEPPARPYLVMELVDGPSLAALLKDGPLGPVRTLEIISQAAAGLQAAHAAGLVHRDVKPGNLLVGNTGQVKIADFGIAHAVGSVPVTRTGELVGTPAYLSPEQVMGAHATPASDLYALGILAYQCLTGEVPFTGEPLAVALAHQERSLPPLPPPVPLGVAALVAALTAKDPQARPPSAGHVAQRAAQLRAGLAAKAGAGASSTLTPTSALAAALAAPTAIDLPAAAGAPAADTADTADLAVTGTRHAAAGVPDGTAGGQGDAMAASTGAAIAGGAVAAGALAAAGTQAPAPGAAADGAPGDGQAIAGGPGGVPSWPGPAATGPVPVRRRFPGAAARSLPRRGALAAAGLALFGLAGWALSSLPGTGPQQRVAPPPAAHPSGPVLDPGASPVSTPGSQTVATPRATGHRHKSRPAAAASPTGPASPAPTQPPPTPTGQPTPSPSPSAVPSVSPSSVPSPAPT